MAKYDKPITEFDECPHCGSEHGFYQKLYLSGWTEDVTLFSGEKYNYHYHDGLKDSRHSKYYFCTECNERITRVGNES